MSGLRILIVEDDPFIAMDIEGAMLDRFGDRAELVVVESVEKANDAASERFSCALLDIDVVGGKTFGVADTLQDNGTPFAFVSGSTPSEVPVRLQGVRFMRKPFAIAELKSFVAAAITPRLLASGG